MINQIMNTYDSPYEIGLGDSVNYNFKNYLVLINYIKGETDAKGYTPKSNRTILIDNNGQRITVHNYKQLRRNWMLFLTTTVPTYDLPKSPILLLGFAGILLALVTLYIANRDYFGSPLNQDKRIK